VLALFRSLRRQAPCAHIGGAALWRAPPGCSSQAAALAPGAGSKIRARRKHRDRCEVRASPL